MKQDGQSAISPTPRRSIFGWLKLWFLLTEPVGRRDYVISGFGLMAVKYLVELTAVWWLTGRIYTPIDFVNPLLSAREKFAAGAPDWFGFAWVVWTLPFLWIALGMSVRRALNAGVSPWNGLWVLAPLVNLLVMLLLAILPESKPAQIVNEELPELHAARTAHVTTTVMAAVGGVAAGALYALVVTLSSVYLFDSYGAAVFFGAPLITGIASSYLLNWRDSYSYGLSTFVAVAALACFGVALLLFALEGAICIAMVIPIVLPLGFAGGLVGKFLADLQRGCRRNLAAALLALPTISALEAVLPPSNEFVVVSSVDIAASRETVWQNVIGFSEITERPEWIFRFGIACPTEARIFGEGVGARRECIFSTGKFVEPITRWDVPERLSFDVREQPLPMLELTPYRHVHPPHLDIAFRTVRGEFELQKLPGGGTRLIGRTWYVLDIQPNAYWTIWGDWLVHRIHLRVLRHIKQLSEAAGAA